MKDIQELRNHIADAMERIKKGQMTVHQGKVYSELAGQMIETGKLEMEFLKHTRNTRHSFIPLPETAQVLEEKAAALVGEKELTPVLGWTEEDTKSLITLYPHHSVDVIAARLGKTRSEIINRACILQLTKDRNE